MKETVKWYLIHTYSGYEKKVKTELDKRIQNLNLTDKVFRIIVPEEMVEEEKRGKVVLVPKKIFPSYVMVEMLTMVDESNSTLMYKVDSQAWYVIRNTTGVTGFLGVGSDPIPMTEEEVEKIFERINYVENDRFKVGDKVRIISESFKNYETVIEEVDKEKNMVKVTVEMFNRPTVLYLKDDEIEKI